MNRYKSSPVWNHIKSSAMILHVMQLLGHKNIKYTLKYTQLVNFQDDDYICKVARKPEEIKDLIEAGFEYVTDQDDLKFFRKRR